MSGKLSERAFLASINRTRKQAGGFTLIEVMLTAGVISISTIALVSFTKLSLEVDRKTRTKQNISQAKAEVISLLSNQDLWLDHVAKAGEAHPTLSGHTVNDDLACIRDHSACADSPHPLTLFDGGSKIVIDPQVSTQGFTANGEACNSFGSSGATNPCIYRLELNWSPVCPSSGTCLNPQVKVNITLKSYDTQTLATNQVETLPYSLMTDTTKARAPIVKSFATATNSALYHPSESILTIDPLPYVFNDYKTTYTVSLPPSGQSADGNSINLSGNQIVYTPAPNYYGLDSVQYTVTDQRSGLSTSGRFWVKVMTPYTWIGRASNLLASSAANFCGKVVMGVCDSATFPAGGHDKVYIFNKTCDSCSSEIDVSPISAIDMKADFPGQVSAQTNLIVQADSANIWKKIPVFHQGAGSFDSNGNNIKVLANALGYPWDHSQYGFVIDPSAGTFRAPPVLKISGPTIIRNGANFQHNNGLVTFYSLLGANYEVTAPGINFYNVAFDDVADRLGSPYGFNVTDDFTVLNNLYNNPQDAAGSISGNGTISLHGDIHLTGFGGAENNGPGPATIKLIGIGNQTIFGVPAPAMPVVVNTKAEHQNLTSFLPSVKIAKPSGNTIALDWIGFEGLDASTAAAFDTSAATFVFGADSGTNTWRPGNFYYPNVYVVTGGSGNGDLFFDGGLFRIGNLYDYSYSGSHLYGRFSAAVDPSVANTTSDTVIEVDQNLSFHCGFADDKLSLAATVKMVGANNAIIKGETTSTSPFNLVIEKSAGAGVTMQGGYSTARSITSLPVAGVTQLTLDPGITVRVPSHGYNSGKSIFKVPNVVFHNLELDHNFVLASDINVDGDLTWGSHGGGNASLSIVPVSDFHFNLSGNLNIESGLPNGGGAMIFMTGNNDSDINSHSATRLGMLATKLNIQKTSPAAVNFKAADIIGGSYNSGTGVSHMSNSFMSVGGGSTLNIIGGTLQVSSLSVDAGGVVNYSGGGQLCTQATDLSPTICHTGP